MAAAVSDWSTLWDARPGWLNTASYGLPPRLAYTALDTVLDQWRHGSSDWAPWDESVTRARTLFARLIGAQPADVTVSSTASHIVSAIATALPADATVLVPDIEFTSNVFPWAVAARVRTAPAERLAEHITPGISAVAFSLVQSATGHVTDPAPIVEAARARGCLVIADASQACGWLPFTVEGLDAVVCAAYKWLMAPRGAAFGYLSPLLRERMRPLAANWYGAAERDSGYYGMPLRLADDARAFDLSPAWFSYVGAAPALEVVLTLGVAAIGEHNLALANRLRTELGRPPSDSPIVSLDADPARLAAAGIRAAVRAGRARLSFHAYNTHADVERALEALR
ncbi:aminotransferase class V-fold PLP-dependent enzyme [Nonomuraea typhae]|uniref:aminotransferase class V-fold PLP-dependent enzyme n=1 Tax=Nonomuraea typhae TaxID=2603600 RepID=UPI0012FAF86C|nr:aminotransferase class V-fold PLP-dependent enzyme [Nonomuraea typhae]